MSTAKKITAAKKSDAAKKATAKLAKGPVPIITHYSNVGRGDNEDYIRSSTIADGYVVFDESQVLQSEHRSLESFEAALKNGEFDEGTYYLYRITPIKIVVVKD